jgi:hypothetical protein
MEYYKPAAQAYVDAVNAKRANGEWKHVSASISPRYGVRIRVPHSPAKSDACQAPPGVV